MYRIICLLLCVTALRAEPIFQNCGSTEGEFTSVSVSDCTAAHDRCILKRNTNATIQIQFNVNKETTGVKAIVHGVLPNVPVPVPFPISNPDACAYKDSGITCPLAQNGGPYTYTATLFVRPEYPRISVNVKWELQDPTGKNIVCILIPAKIQ